MSCVGVPVQLQELVLVLGLSGAYNIKQSAALIKVCICLLKGEYIYITPDVGASHAGAP